VLGPLDDVEVTFSEFARRLRKRNDFAAEHVDGRRRGRGVVGRQRARRCVLMGPVRQRRRGGPPGQIEASEVSDASEVSEASEVPASDSGAVPLARPERASSMW
jgi:hypothetical protein